MNHIIRRSAGTTRAFIAGVAVALAAGALALPLVAAPNDPRPAAGAGVPISRFQMAPHPNGLYYLDTVTGEIWISTSAEGGDPPRLKWLKLNSPVEK